MKTDQIITRGDVTRDVVGRTHSAEFTDVPPIYGSVLCGHVFASEEQVQISAGIKLEISQVQNLFYTIILFLKKNVILL